MSLNDSTATVFEMTKSFVSFLDVEISNWKRGFYRFEANEQMSGANSSYENSGGVFILPAIKYANFFGGMNTLAHSLRDQVDLVKPKFCVMLLSVDCDSNYKIDFEFKDAKRWGITKLDGASGIPIGIE